MDASNLPGYLCLNVHVCMQCACASTFRYSTNQSFARDVKKVAFACMHAKVRTPSSLGAKVCHQRLRFLTFDWHACMHTHAYGRCRNILPDTNISCCLRVSVVKTSKGMNSMSHTYRSRGTPPECCTRRHRKSVERFVLCNVASVAATL
jgi:hypothetical protein